MYIVQLENEPLSGIEQSSIRKLPAKFANGFFRKKTMYHNLEDHVRIFFVLLIKYGLRYLLFNISDFRFLMGSIKQQKSGCFIFFVVVVVHVPNEPVLRMAKFCWICFVFNFYYSTNAPNQRCAFYLLFIFSLREPKKTVGKIVWLVDGETFQCQNREFSIHAMYHKQTNKQTDKKQMCRLNWLCCVQISFTKQKQKVSLKCIKNNRDDIVTTTGRKHQ